MYVKNDIKVFFKSGYVLFWPIPSKVKQICTKSSIYFKLARGWTRKDKGNYSLKVISCVHSLWPNDYSQHLDICIIPSYNRGFLIVQWCLIMFCGRSCRKCKKLIADMWALRAAYTSIFIWPCCPYRGLREVEMHVYIHLWWRGWGRSNTTNGRLKYWGRLQRRWG